LATTVAPLTPCPGFRKRGVPQALHTLGEAVARGVGYDAMWITWYLLIGLVLGLMGMALLAGLFLLGVGVHAGILLMAAIEMVLVCTAFYRCKANPRA